MPRAGLVRSPRGASNSGPGPCALAFAPCLIFSGPPACGNGRAAGRKEPHLAAVAHALGIRLQGARRQSITHPPAQLLPTRPLRFSSTRTRTVTTSLETVLEGLGSNSRTAKRADSLVPKRYGVHALDPVEVLRYVTFSVFDAGPSGYARASSRRAAATSSRPPPTRWTGIALWLPRTRSPSSCTSRPGAWNARGPIPSRPAPGRAPNKVHPVVVWDRDGGVSVHGDAHDGRWPLRVGCADGARRLAAPWLEASRKGKKI